MPRCHHDRFFIFNLPEFFNDVEVAPLRTRGTTGSRTGDIRSKYISLYTNKVIPSIEESSDTICGKSWEVNTRLEKIPIFPADPYDTRDKIFNCRQELTMNRCNMGVECLWRVEGQSRRNTFFFIMMELNFLSHDDSGCDHDGEDDVRYDDGDGDDGGDDDCRDDHGGSQGGRT